MNGDDDYEGMPDPDETINPDMLPDGFDTDDLPDGWENWTWDDFWAWLESDGLDYYELDGWETWDIDGDSPTGACNGG